MNSDTTPPDAGASGATLSPSSGDTLRSVSGKASNRVSGRDLIRYGRTHMGTPYYLSPPAPCWAYHKEDCSCFTHIVFRHFGKRLPDSPVLQWRYGNLIRYRSNLRPGDLLFFKEHGYNHPITHVGMYAGHGNILHASSYFGKVVESKMKYIRGYYGARRVKAFR
jgi:cell wall-associated NlpC family hydrolase